MFHYIVDTSSMFNVRIATCYSDWTHNQGCRERAKFKYITLNFNQNLKYSFQFLTTIIILLTNRIALIPVFVIYSNINGKSLLVVCADLGNYSIDLKNPFGVVFHFSAKATRCMYTIRSQNSIYVGQNVAAELNIIFAKCQCDKNPNK